jgi:ribosome biogenesis GTPase A
VCSHLIPSAFPTVNNMDGVNYEKMNIQWFPGHMTKAQRMIEDSIKQVDAVCEILDARIPNSSRNPDIDRLAAGKPRLIILNRTDLADPSITAQWREFFEAQGIKILETDARSGKGVSGFAPALSELLKDKIASYAAKGQVNRPMRVMILGIPNVGKSTFINKIAKRKAAIAGDKPGVTRGKQWINIDKGLDLLDTPGILWPKFDSQEVGEMLAITNAIKADVLDKETLAANFMLRLREMYPEALTARYKLEPDPEANGFELLEQAAKKRGFLISKGEYDIERMANTLLGEYHDGKLGRISLEKP